MVKGFYVGLFEQLGLYPGTESFLVVQKSVFNLLQELYNLFRFARYVFTEKNMIQWIQKNIAS